MFSIIYYTFYSRLIFLREYFHFVYPFGLRFQLRPNRPGNPMARHLLRCQGFAVAYYGFTLGRLGYGAPSTFAQLGFYNLSFCTTLL